MFLSQLTRILHHARLDSQFVGAMTSRFIDIWRERERHHALGSCTTADRSVFIDGTPNIENAGELHLGRDVALCSRPNPLWIRVHKGASLCLEDNVSMGCGTILGVRSRVVIGARTRVGANCTIVDHCTGDIDPSIGAQSRQILIGEDVEIGPRVTIMRGTRIGHHSVITAGTVVTGDVPPNTLVAGHPARVIGLNAPLRAHEPLLASAIRIPDKVAIIGSNVVLSYRELWNLATTLAAAIRQRLQPRAPNETVLFVSRSKVDFVVAMYACWIADTVAVPVPEGAVHSTILEMLERVNSRLVIADQVSVPDDWPLTRMDGVTLLRPSDITETKSLPEVSPPLLPGPGRQALILFTSGTTSTKKAVVLSHASVLAATRNINEFMQPDESIREFVSVPLYHSFGLGRVRSLLTAGGSLVLLDGHFNPGVAIEAIQHYECSALSAVPAGLALFRGELESALRRIGPQIRLIELGSAFLAKERKAALVDLFPCARICMHYGLTEASRSTFLEFRNNPDKLDSVGRPSPNVRIRVCDADGHPCNFNVEGEITIAGEHVTEGYLNDEPRTRESFTHDGWLRTGDFGFIDADGYLHLLGRRDEMINKGGVKISPLEIEATIRQVFPELDACVVGVPDPSGFAGEVPVVAYVGETELKFQEFVDAVAPRLERSKLPSALVRVPEIPRTDNGKPKRKQLQAELCRSSVLGKPS